MDSTPSAGRRRLIKGLAAAALIGAGAIGGGIAASTLAASADPTTTPTTSSSPSAQSSTDTGPGRGHGGIGGSTPVRSDEKSVSAADEATLKAAALKAVPGGTVVRIETDSGDAKYEAHMTKADGSVVTVKFDANKAVVGVEDGMGK